MAQAQTTPRKLPAAAALSRFHAYLYRVTGGKFGGRVAGQKIVVMNVVGRRTGVIRPTPVVGMEHKGALYVVASHNGAPQNPVWFANLRDRPEITVVVDGLERTVRAEVLAEPERRQVWRALVEAMPLYGKVQAKTSRVIPVVRLRSFG